VNNMAVEQGMWIPTAGLPELCHRQLPSLFRSLTISKRLPPAWRYCYDRDNCPARGVSSSAKG
jgi:hypothetical protein